MNPEDLIGCPVDALPTPALLVDVDALGRNLKLLADFFAGKRCRLRPHFKSHKCVSLARRQLAAGNAVGMTAAKLSEAEVLVAGGIEDVLIANQVVGDDKARRVARLVREAEVRVVVDSPENVDQLSRAARAEKVTIGVLVEVDIGMNRCGVPPGQPTVKLARKVHQADGLRLDGLQGFEGHVVLMRDKSERDRQTAEAIHALVRTKQTVEAAGLPCPIVSGGGTGTYDITGNIAGMDELQAGSYALMDSHYRTVRPEFECALNVLATVISARPNKVVLDVGLKGMGNDFGLPAIKGAPEAKVLYVAEEHLPVENLDGKVGDRTRLIPTHWCTTCNLYRRLWLERNGIVEAVWPIEGSGKLE